MKIQFVSHRENSVPLLQITMSLVLFGGGEIEHAYTLWLIVEFLVLSLVVINLSGNHWLPFPLGSFIALTRQAKQAADKRCEVNQVK